MIETKIPVLKKDVLCCNIYPSLEHNENAIIGKKCPLKLNWNSFDSWAEMANILSMYKNNNYETVRYIIIGDGKIKDQITVSTHIPGQSDIYESEFMLEKLHGLLSKNDDFFILVHNHPSGNSNPSQQDIKITDLKYNTLNPDPSKEWEKAKKIFLGHIIIGNGNFTFQDCDRKQKNGKSMWFGIENGIVKENNINNQYRFNIPDMHKLSLPQKPFLYDGKDGKKELYDGGLIGIVKNIMKVSDLNTKENICLVYSDSTRGIAGLKVVSKDFFRSPNRDIINEMTNDAKKCGAVYALAIGFDETVIQEANRWQSINKLCCKDNNGLPLTNRYIQGVIANINGKNVWTDYFGEQENMPIYSFRRFKIETKDTRKTRKMSKVNTMEK